MRKRSASAVCEQASDSRSNYYSTLIWLFQVCEAYFFLDPQQKPAAYDMMNRIFTFMTFQVQGLRELTLKRSATTKEVATKEQDQRQETSSSSGHETEEITVYVPKVSSGPTGSASTSKDTTSHKYYMGYSFNPPPFSTATAVFQYPPITYALFMPETKRILCNLLADYCYEVSEENSRILAVFDYKT